MRGDMYQRDGGAAIFSHIAQDRFKTADAATASRALAPVHSWDRADQWGGQGSALAHRTSD